MPESRTSTSTPSAPSCAETIVNSRGRSFTALIASIAFTIRLSSTCCSCTRSPITGGSVAGQLVSNTMLLRNSCSVSARTSPIFRLTSSKSMRGACRFVERPDPRDDFARPLAVGDDVVERRARFRHRAGPPPASARGAGARDHRAQGLAHLVGDRGGQLAQRRQARHASKLRPRHLQRIVLFAQLLLRELALADVAREREVEAAALPAGTCRCGSRRGTWCRRAVDGASRT